MTSPVTRRAAGIKVLETSAEIVRRIGELPPDLKLKMVVFVRRYYADDPDMMAIADLVERWAREPDHV